MLNTAQYYVVIDTNVIVSAMMKPLSIPNRILKMVDKRQIIPLLNNGILAEYINVLNRPKFHFPVMDILSTLNTLVSHGIFIDTTLDVVVRDPKDRVFYAVVMEKRKDDDAYLVTGNKRHFPEVHFVVNPREMLEIIMPDNEEL